MENGKMPSPFCIGITGAFNSGCTESARYLRKKHNLNHISLSEVLRKHYSLPRNTGRKKMQDYGNEIRSGEDGRDALMKLALSEPHSVPIVVEAIRNPAEAEFLLRMVPDTYLLAIYADEDTRLKRYKKSLKDKGQKFTPDKEKAFKEDDFRDSGEMEHPHGQKVTDCVNMSDYFIENGKSRQTLHRKLDNFVDYISGDEKYLPSDEEIMMSHAFMHRLLSKCKGRQVGAVIARDKQIISLGWNGVPQPETIGHCDECRRKKLLRCEKCGGDLLEGVGICKNCRKKDREKKSLLEKHLDLCYAVHAEERAILAAKGNGILLAGATLYCTTFPCLLCAKVILETGITKLVYVEPYPHSKSRELFDLVGDSFTIQRFEGFTARNLYRIHVKGD